MSKKTQKETSTQRKQTVLTWISACVPLLLTIVMLGVYAGADRLILWLVAVTSLSWFVLTGVYLYAMIHKWESVSIKNDAFFKGRPITPKEATFLAYMYAVIFFALGVMFAIVFFIESLFV